MIRNNKKLSCNCHSKHMHSYVVFDFDWLLVNILRKTLKKQILYSILTILKENTIKRNLAAFPPLFGRYFLRLLWSVLNISLTHSMCTYTASSIAQWQSAGFECGRSRVQSPVKDASYQRRYKNGTSSALVQHSTLKRENNVMDKIWYRNPSKSEVIGRCGGDEKNE